MSNGPCLTLLLLTLFGHAEAARLEVEVRDRDGRPLSEVVAWIEPGPDTPSPSAEPTAPVALVMDQRKRQFTPYILPVHRGSTVIFPNSDPINHHVYSFSPAKRFELRLHHQGDSAQQLRFDAPGLVTLGCNIHDWMLGFILVLDSPWFAQTDQGGRARLEYLPAAGQTLHIWHPRSAEPGVAYPLAPRVEIRLTQALKREPRSKAPNAAPRGKGGYLP
ncbi:MAG TPA: methylamine utilization protein [Pseudomonas sp.]|nr:methylamine utilization protein [Pseudomonas sp.]